MSETLPHLTSKEGFARWSNPNIFKVLKRLGIEDPVAYRVDNFQIEIEEHQFNTFDRSVSRLKKEFALKNNQGESASRLKYLASSAVAAARSKLAPIKTGLLTVTNTDDPLLSSLFPYIHYPLKSGKGSVYVYQDKNGLNLDQSELLDMFKKIRSDKIDNPYSLTDIELNVLANKHREPIFNLQNMFRSQAESGQRALRLGAYQFKLRGDEALKSFTVSIPNLIGFSQEYVFEILDTKYGSTISVVPETQTSIHEMPFGDLDALRVPINDDFLVSLVQTHQ